MILLALRWYLRYGMSCRDLEELLAERGIEVGAQCAELASVLASYVGGATVFGGDVNRHESCAPAGWWTLTDAAASQAPGIQHVYGNERLASPTGTVVPAVYTDHDFLRADARRTPEPR